MQNFKLSTVLSIKYFPYHFLYIYIGCLLFVFLILHHFLFVIFSLIHHLFLILLYRFFLQICYQFSPTIRLFFQFIILFRGLNFFHLILKIAEWAPIVEFVFNLFLIETNLTVLIFHQLPNLIYWYCCFLTVWIVRVFLNYFYCWNYML